MIKTQPINTESHTNHQETKYRSTYLFSSKSNQRKMNPPINANSDYTYLCNVNKQNPSYDEKEKNFVFVRYHVRFYLIIQSGSRG